MGFRASRWFRRAVLDEVVVGRVAGIKKWFLQIESVQRWRGARGVMAWGHCARRGCSSPAFASAGFWGPVDRSGSGLLLCRLSRWFRSSSRQESCRLNWPWWLPAWLRLGAAPVLEQDTGAAEVVAGD